MNKLFTKITSLALGAAMMIGVGVSVGSKKVSAAHADTVEFVAGTDTGAASVTKSGITVSMSTMSRTDNYRCYSGSSFSVTSTVGNITNIALTFSGSNTGGFASSINVSPAAASYTSPKASGQARMTKIVVTYSGGTPFTPDHAGTSADPYSVADARGAIDAGSGTSGKYAKGIVKEIPYPWTSANGITFNIVDKEGDTSFLQAYKCKNTSGPALTSIEVGDTVVVSGNLKKYNTTYEFDTGCTLISRTGKEITDLSVNTTGAKTSYNVNETFSSDGIVVTATVAGQSGIAIDSTDYSVSSPDMTTAGQKTVTVTYTGTKYSYATTISTTYNINVILPSPDKTIALIADIGTVVYTQECNDKIVAARLSYDALPAASQKNVTNYDVLESAESDFDDLVLSKVDNVETLINEIGTVTLSSGTAISAAETAYDALLEGKVGKELVSNYATLTAARATYDALVADRAAADAVEAKIDLLPAASSITDYSHHTDIAAARKAYEALTKSQKGMVDAVKLQKLADCEAADAQFEPQSIVIEHNWTGTSAANMDGTNQAATYFNLDDSVWSVVGNKNTPQNNIGLNKDGTIRLYADKNSGDGNMLVVSALDASYTITTIEIEFSTTVGAYEVKSGDTVVTQVDGVYTINNSSFSIQNVNTGSTTQVHILSITVCYSVEESQTADDFIDAVDAIPAVADINASNLETVNGLIATADSEYAKLTPELKEDSTVIAKKAVLDAAKEKAVDVGYEVEAAPVIAAIDALPAASSITDYSHHSDIVAARSLYEGLSAEAKAKVSNLAKLEACEAKDAEYAPLSVTIDTDGGQDHSGDSGATGAFADADALSTAYPTNSSLIEWTDCTTTYGSDSSVLKLGSGKNTGSVKLSFTHDRLYAPSVTLDAKAWSDKTVTVSINGVEQSFSGVNHSLTFDLSSVEFTGDVVITTTSSERRISIYGIDVAYAYRADYQGALTFEENFIKKNIAYPETTPTGVAGTACLPTSEGGQGYFDAAVAEYNNNVSAASKIEFANHIDFAKARERFVAWGLANRKTVTFDATTGAITVTPIGMSLINNMFATSESTATTVIIIISVIGVSALGGFFFLRKRKEI